jgi:predicted CXXCH cytochrome family protein
LLFVNQTFKTKKLKPGIIHKMSRSLLFQCLHWTQRWSSRRRFAALALALGAGAIAVLVESCSTVDRTAVAPLQIEGATFVGDKVCADCHDHITRAFPASPHARLHLASAERAGQTGCESCHGPGSKHVAAGHGGREFIINPGKNPTACFQCHTDTEAEFHLPQHHLVIEGKMNCVQCHDPHGMDIMKPAGGLAMGRQDQSCTQCHREQTKPVIFEHPAMREGCATCHNPHGSINPKMLTVRDSNLCLRCHAQVQEGAGHLYIGNVDHATYVRYGTCWTAGCHTAVHGSNTQPFFFY